MFGLKACLLVLCVAGATLPAGAQQVRTLVIRDGKVYVDGTQLSADKLPASLQVEGTRASFSFVGDARPVIELGSRFYRLDGHSLREVPGVPQAYDPVQVFFRDRGHTPAPAPGQSTVVLRQAPDETRITSPPGAFYELQSTPARLIEQQALELARLSEEIEARQAVEAPHMAARVRVHADRMARAAEELPLLEWQYYLSDIEQRNHALFEALQRERMLESETTSLAARIRALPAGDARNELTERLRRSLEKIFELKQENRRREIKQLETQLEALQQRLREREEMHDLVIEQRLEELLHPREERDW